MGAGGWASFNVGLPARVPSDQSLRTHPLGGLDLFIMGCPNPDNRSDTVARMENPLRTPGNYVRLGVFARCRWKGIETTHLTWFRVSAVARACAAG